MVPKKNIEQIELVPIYRTDGDKPIRMVVPRNEVGLYAGDVFADVVEKAEERENKESTK